MPWVVKIPKRADFCGCPPCALCFDFVHDQPADQPQEVMSGIDKMIEDIVGKPAEQATPAEVAIVQKVAEEIHERNLKGEKPKTEPPKDGAFFVNNQDAEWLNKRISEKRRAKVAEEKYQTDLKKPKTLDQLADAGEFQEEGKDGAPKEGEKLRVEVSPGRVVEMTQEEYQRYVDSVVSNKRI